MKSLTTGERLLANKAYHSVMMRPAQVWDAFWDDRLRMLRVRKVAGRRDLPPPVGAIHVGRYDASSTWEQVIDDLNATIEFNTGEVK